MVRLYRTPLMTISGLWVRIRTDTSWIGNRPGRDVLLCPDIQQACHSWWRAEGSRGGKVVFSSGFAPFLSSWRGLLPRSTGFRHPARALRWAFGPSRSEYRHFAGAPEEELGIYPAPEGHLVTSRRIVPDPAGYCGGGATAGPVPPTPMYQ